jgi:uncharacterized FlgJ-related protein
MPEGENIEKQELSREIVEEWYAEKGLSFEKVEEKEVKEEKFFSPPPSFVVDEKENKRKEDEKKLLIKKDIKNLLAIAEKKGLEQSIKEAQKKNDPFLLDIYHDVLAKDAAYKRFLNHKK